MFERLKEWLAFFIVSFLGFGTSFYCIKLALKELTSLEVVTYRVTIACLFLLATSLISGININIKLSKIFNMMLLGVVSMAIPFWLIIWAEKYISSSLAGILNSFTPILTLVLGIFIISRKELNIKSVSSALIGFIGIIVIFADKFSLFDINHIMPELAVVIATFFYAISGIIVKKYFSNVHPIALSLYSSLGSSLCLIIILFSSQNSITIPYNSLPPLLWMGAIGTALSSVLMYYLINHWGAFRASMISYFIPLSAIILGCISLNEKLDKQVIVGGSLILLATFISNNSAKNR